MIVLRLSDLKPDTRFRVPHTKATGTLVKLYAGSALCDMEGVTTGETGELAERRMSIALSTVVEPEESK